MPNPILLPLMAIVMLSLLLNGFALHQDDSIDLLVAGLNQEPMWNAGLQPAFDLPEKTSPIKVAGLAIGASGQGFAKPKRPLVFVHCSESVTIGDDRKTIYTALHCHTTMGERIVLMRYMEDSERWFARVYDAKAIRAEMKKRLLHAP